MEFGILFTIFFLLNFFELLLYMKVFFFLKQLVLPDKDFNKEVSEWNKVLIFVCTPWTFLVFFTHTNFHCFFSLDLSILKSTFFLCFSATILAFAITHSKLSGFSVIFFQQLSSFVWVKINCYCCFSLLFGELKDDRDK